MGGTRIEAAVVVGGDTDGKETRRFPYSRIHSVAETKRTKKGSQSSQVIFLWSLT